uniref:Tektin n=1 Tax=Trichogramma kaykai TaxID=54128 RepID=A0ABD2WGH6_9HYME
MESEQNKKQYYNNEGDDDGGDYDYDDDDDCIGRDECGIYWNTESSYSDDDDDEDVEMNSIYVDGEAPIALRLSENKFYDLNCKRLTNIASPIEDSDAIDLMQLQSRAEIVNSRIARMREKILIEVESTFKKIDELKCDLMNRRIGNVAYAVNENDLVNLKCVNDEVEIAAKKISSINEGPRGHGFELTTNEDFDMQSKKLRNIADGESELDVVNASQVNNEWHELQELYKKHINDARNQLQNAIELIDKTYREQADQLFIEFDIKSGDIERNLREQLPSLVCKNADNYYGRLSC